MAKAKDLSTADGDLVANREAQPTGKPDPGPRSPRDPDLLLQLSPYDDAVEGARISRILDECLPPAEVDEVFGDTVYYKDPYHRQSRLAKQLSGELEYFARTLDMVNSSDRSMAAANAHLEYFINHSCESLSNDIYIRDSERAHVRNLITISFNKYFADLIKETGYTDELGAGALPAIIYLPDQSEPEPAPPPPPSEAAVTPPLRMGDDFNTALAGAKAAWAAARLSANYEALIQHVDLTNPKLPEVERLRRAERLLRTYEALRKANPDFDDTGDQIRAAHRIHKAAYRERQRAKNGAPKRPRGRPRTKGLNI